MCESCSEPQKSCHLFLWHGTALALELGSVVLQASLCLAAGVVPWELQAVDMGRGPGEGEGKKGWFDTLMLPGTAAELSASSVRPSLVGRAEAWLACHCSAQPRTHFLGTTQAPSEPLGLARGCAVPNLCVLLVLGMLQAGVGKLPVLMMLILLSGSSINLVLTSLTSFKTSN